TWLKITAKEPLLLGGIKTGTAFLSSLTYIPGRVLRGAWVDQLIASGQEREITTTVEQVHIGNFFPAVEWRPVRYAAPQPLSAFTCKREAGLRSEPHPRRRGHGVVDLLLPRLAYRLLEQAGARFRAPFAANCAKCCDRLETASG